MKTNTLIIAAIFFALGFIIAWQVGTPKMAQVTNTNTEVDDQTKVIFEEPDPNSVVTSPLTVRGQVRGGWYFEASFPVEIVDSYGKVLGTAPAQAQDDWMQEGFVPFIATVTFDPGGATNGEIVLKKDNPSGLPGNDDEVRLPIKFK